MLYSFGWFMYIAATGLGVAVGSFLNVVAYRLGTGRSLAGRSFCLSCARRLRWYELVPIISFFVLRGRCRTCRSKISIQYLLVELLTGAIFFALAWQFFHTTIDIFATSELFFHIIVWPLLIVILVYDLRHKIIPDAFVYAVAVLSLLYQIVHLFLFGASFPLYVDLASGPILFIPFFLLWVVSHGRWIGLGDAKLALGIGWMLGFGGGISAVVFGFWSGAFVGLCMIAFSRLTPYIPEKFASLKRGMKKVTMKSELAFGPFLIAGIFAVEFFGFSLFFLFS